MTVGGLRARLLNDSFTGVVVGGLTTLDWFEDNRAHSPITVITNPREWDVSINGNLLVITIESVSTEWVEVGSRLLQDRIPVMIDFYAENESLGVHLTNDLRDVLRGRLPGGADNGRFPILDLRQATPSAIGYVEIEDVRAVRTISQFAERWAGLIFSVTCDLVDHYYSEAA